MAGSNLAKQSENLPQIIQGNPVLAVLTQFDSNRYNLVTPVCAIDRLPPMTRVSVQVVMVDPDNDTYPLPGQTKVGINKNALNKIAAAANISWEPERSGQVDTWDDPHRVRYRAVGIVHDFNGRERVISGEKEIDLRGETGDPDSWGKDTSEFCRIAGSKRDPWNQISQQRQHIISLAETKAKLRAIREALSIPQGMTKADIAKPWVVPSLVPEYDTSDPEIKRMLVAQRLGATAALYGGPRQTVAAAPSQLQTPLPAGDDDFEDEPIDVSEFDVVEEAEMEDPFADDETTSDGCPLPIPDEILRACPTNDEARYCYLQKINAMAERAIAKFGSERACQVFRKHASGFEWITAPAEALVAVHGSIVDDLKGGDA